MRLCLTSSCYELSLGVSLSKLKLCAYLYFAKKETLRCLLGVVLLYTSVKVNLGKKKNVISNKLLLSF